MLTLLGQATDSNLPMILFVVGGLLVMFFVFTWLILQRYVKVGPNEALVISGRERMVADGRGGSKRIGYRVVRGGRAWPIPFLEKVEVLSLELMTIDVKTPEVYSVTGVPVTVEGVAQVKIRSDEVSIGNAAERFLGKTPSEIMSVALHTLEGHLRAIIGRLTVEDLYRDRDAFAAKVQEVTSGDFSTMGLSIDSFTIKEIRDSQGYLDALGKPRTAQVKRDATIGEAEARRDATIKQSEADRDATIKSSENIAQAQKAKFLAETQVAQSEAEYQKQRQEFIAQVNEKKAKADQVYPLEQARAQQSVKLEEMKVLEIEKERMIEIKQKELQASVTKPAEAERKRMEEIAEGQKKQAVLQAEGQAVAAQNVGRGEAEAVKARGLGEAEAIRAKGLAEAEVIMAKGQAEAEAMKKKADAWRAYNEAAIAQMFIEKLPELARAVAEPLGRVDKITIVSTGNGDGGVGASKITKDIVDVIAQLPPVLEGVSGVNLKEMLGRIPGLSGKGSDGGKK